MADETIKKVKYSTAFTYDIETKSFYKMVEFLVPLHIATGCSEIALEKPSFEGLFYLLVSVKEGTKEDEFFRGQPKVWTKYR